MASFEMVAKSPGGNTIGCWWPGLTLRQLHERAMVDDPMWFQKPRFVPLTEEAKEVYRRKDYGFRLIK